MATSSTSPITPAGWLPEIPRDQGGVGIQRDPNAIAADITAGKAKMQENRNKLTDFYNQINTIYTDMINSGRQAEAADLRSAAERFAAIGSQLGVSSGKRAAALADLSNAMRVKGMGAESQAQAQRMQELRALTGEIATMDQNALNQNFNEMAKATVQGEKPTSPISDQMAYSYQNVANQRLNKYNQAKLKQEGKDAAAKLAYQKGKDQQDLRFAYDKMRMDAFKANRPESQPRSPISAPAPQPQAPAGQTWWKDPISGQPVGWIPGGGYRAPSDPRAEQMRGREMQQADEQAARDRVAAAARGNARGQSSSPISGGLKPAPYGGYGASVEQAILNANKAKKSSPLNLYKR